MSYQSELYKQVILEHNKKPRNYRHMDDESKTHSCEGNNPLCGDELVVYLKINNDIIEDISFEGHGCAISKSSSSMMTLAVKGRSIKEANLLFSEFHNMILGEFDPDKEENHLGKLKIFKGVCEFPARAKCATLPWHTLSCAIANKQQISSE